MQKRDNEFDSEQVQLSALIEELDREDVEQAKRMTGSQKLRAGGDLFDDGCRWTMAGIRHDYPGISDADALTELRRRVSMEELDVADFEERH
jgi:hypothetical protein